MTTAGDLIHNQGMDFIVKRGFIPDRCIRGFCDKDSHTKETFVGFTPESDIQPGDILVDRDGDCHRILKTEIIYDETNSPWGIKAYYTMLSRNQPINQSPAPIFNVQI